MHTRHWFRVVLGLASPFVLLAGSGHADTYPRANELDVLEYTFRVTLTDESDVVEGLASVDLRWLQDGVRSFELDLSSAQDGTGMTVAGVWVRSSDGASTLSPQLAEPAERGARTPFAHEADRLRIELPKASIAGERSYVTVQYSGVPVSGLEIGETHHGERCFFSENWPNRARQWMPTIDHPYDKAKSQMIVIAPDHYQVVSNGLLVETTDLDGGQRRTHWRQSVPIATWLYNLGVARFAVQHLDDFEGVPVQTWVYARDRDAGFHDFAAPTHSALRFFSERVGPYEYEKLANVQCASIGGGMESASAIFYGQDLVDGTRSVRLQNVVVHELAHQWFGNSVTESDWDDVWLSEGFATYFTLLYREHARGREDFVEGLRDARDRVVRFYADRPDYRVVHQNLDDMSQVTTGMQYQKGAWILHMLRRQLGTETYWQGIRDYYALYRNGTASTADFRRVMEERSGQELGWFFEQWLNQGGLPRIEGSWSHAGGTLTLDLRQTQERHRFRLPLELRLDFADGTSARETVLLEGDRNAFSIELNQAPVRVVADPDTWLLAAVELEARQP